MNYLLFAAIAGNGERNLNNQRKPYSTDAVNKVHKAKEKYPEFRYFARKSPKRWAERTWNKLLKKSFTEKEKLIFHVITTHGNPAIYINIDPWLSVPQSLKVWLYMLRIFFINRFY